MARSRASARAAGSWFEGATASFLSQALGDDRIERRAKNGAKDRGDITGVRTIRGERVVIECKNTTRATLGPWLNEAEVERGNDDAAVGVVVHKRTGKGEKAMGEQFVTMSLRDFAVLLGADQDEVTE